MTADQGAPRHELPCASAPWHSYRYRGNYGWVMIGALSHAEALSEAARSVRWHTPTLDRLEVWNVTAYEPANEGNEPA